MRRATWLSLLALGTLGAIAASVACESDSFVGDGGADADSGTDGFVVGGGDASTDAPKDVSITAPRFCESVDASFCSDFDIPNNPGKGWVTNVTAGYDASFQNVKVKSTPMAAESDVPGDAGGSGAYATVLGSLDAGGATTQIAFEADMYIPTLVTSSQPLFMFKFGLLASAQYQFGLAHENAWRFENGAGNVNLTLSSQPAADEWAHVSLSVILSTTGGAIAIAIQSTAGTATATSQVPTAPTTQAFPVQLLIGGSTIAAPNAPTTFFYDNVVINIQ